MKNAICVLYGSKNDVFGKVVFTQCCINNPTKITFDLKKFGPNETHAIHIHEYGDTTDGCTSLGLHYNPNGTTHGSIYDPTRARHAGDLINNFTTDKNGEFALSYTDELVTLFGEKSILGRSVVIHEGIDDCGLGKGKAKKESLISGNAGTRMAGGIIGLMK